MRKFLFHSPNHTDACSWYRGRGAFGQLWRSGWEMSPLPEQVDWASIAGNEVAVMQRPYSENHIKIAGILKSQMPLILDYDDDLFNVPLSNPSYFLYSASEVQKNLATLLGMADLVMVSTPALAESLEAVVPAQYVVVPNAYNDYFLPTTLPTEPREKVVYWRGSTTHDEDLFSYQEEIVKVANDNPKWRFVFVGSAPWMLAGRMNFECMASIGIMEYHKYLRDILKPAVYMAPLVDSVFNRAKSNIGYIEAAMAGALSVLPYWMAKGSHSLPYGSPEAFSTQLQAAISGIETGSAYNRIEWAWQQVTGIEWAWQQVTDTLLLSQINVVRTELMEELTR